MKDLSLIVGIPPRVVAQKRNGPRWRLLPPGEEDQYRNLILLCRNHHKLVDDQPETFTESVLQRIKANHEQWVAKTLGAAVEPI